MATYQKRGTRWRAIVRKKGHPAQSRTFSTKARAQAWARQIENDIEAGLVGQGPIPTLGDLVDGHLVHLEQISNRGRKNKASARNLKAGLGAELLASELSFQKLQEFCQTRIAVDGVKPATTKHDIMFLSGAVTTAIVSAQLPAGFKDKMSSWRVGLQRAGLIGSPQSRDRRPTADELEALLVHTKHNRALRRIRYHDLIRFAVESAMRLDEICSLRWEDVDLEAGTVIIRLRKHPTQKRDQEVPLMGESQGIIEAQPRVDDRVFPYGSESVGNGFRRICRHLEIEDLHFHDLRHEGISRLFERGYQIQEVAMVSGHRDWGSLRRYVNLKAGDLARRDRER
ncbi:MULTISPECIES: site-specific integrase [unclassified Halomonas]|uniref:site-specific integrase n=1 Tax=unclassified Halomonas TaxID=2609666 RepID=UPI002888E7A7|nr:MULTISPECIES: site-specific integrase [unclassified Halomonas]MDT0501604.1 site-specific integrase [Halomonas sp. PAR7]MDT0511039.1 site-specific integrase [Halomonas sp. LES1]MDT0592444.1 site-specific integrase [Halomonas sp. PAR8]